MGGTAAISVETDGTDSVTRILVVGELDIASSKAFDAAVQRCLDTPACKQLRVNLAGVTFCDSTGLGALVDAQDRCEKQGVELLLESPTKSIHRVIELTGLRGLFVIDAG